MNKRIGIKIGSMLGILVAICLLSNIISIISLNNMNRASQELSEKYIVGVNAIANISINIEKEEKFVNILSNASQANTDDSILQTISELREQLQSQISEIENINKNINDTPLPQNVREFWTTYNNYKTNADEIIESYSKSGSQSMSNETYQNMITQINSIDESLTAIRNQYSVLADTAQKQQDSRFTIGYTTITTVAVLGVIIAIIIIIITLKTIVYPAKKAKSEIEALVSEINNNQGDLTKRIQIKSKDEIAQIVKGVNNLLECLQGILKSIKI
ncbi:hypothetical protein CG709_16230, partial [Lachnotalea glycerini]